MTVIIFIIVLAVLIFVHELGHFLFAKMNGIRVDAFAIGFGPKLISWQGKETKYALNLIPFGGYVKIFGENPDLESISGPDAKRSFVHKSRWQQASVLFAGVLFNFLFAWLVYAVIFTNGVAATSEGFEKYADKFSNPRIMITNVLPGSPADKAGIKAGDVIGNVNGASGGIEKIQNSIDSAGESPLAFTFTRGSETRTADIIPTTGLVPDKYAIGIAMQNVVDIKLPFFTAIYEGGRYTVVLIKETAMGLYTIVLNVFRGSANFADIAGPVGIAGIVGNAAELGFTYLLMITALISINLGIINLVPFPALDGGRILFVAIESLTRRKIPHNIGNAVNAVGFVLLMILMVVVTYKDIAKLLVQ